MAAERDLPTLLTTMDPVVRPGAYAYVVAPPGLDPTAVGALATVVEPEGTTLVLPLEQAAQLGLHHDGTFGWITLRVHSALDAVGLTAAVSTALATADISCNVLAGYHHDHLLVPLAQLDRAILALQRLGGRRQHTEHP